MEDSLLISPGQNIIWFDMPGGWQNPHTRSLADGVRIIIDGEGKWKPLKLPHTLAKIGH